MIDIKLLRKENILIGFKIQGHSNYAPHGQDIVCSAVSSVVQLTTIGIVETIGIDPLVNIKKDGFMQFMIPHCGSKVHYEAQVLFETMNLFLTKLQNQYPDYLKIGYIHLD